METSTTVTDSPILDVDAAAAYARCQPATIRQAIRDGKLEAGKLGNQHRVTKRAVARWLGLDPEDLRWSLPTRVDQ